VELSGFGAYLIGTLPITIFELTAKVGYYFHDVKLNVDFSGVGSGNGDVLDTDDNGEAFVYGVGVGVTFIEHINLQVEYEFMDLDKLDDASTLWLNAAWRF
jgi:opacity protein-like surface antigen